MLKCEVYFFFVSIKNLTKYWKHILTYFIFFVSDKTHIDS